MGRNNTNYSPPGKSNRAAAQNPPIEQFNGQRRVPPP
jgi:hypothetical protein